MSKKLKKPDKDRRCLDMETVKKLLNAVKGNKTYYTLVNLMLSSGLRQEEALALTRNDIRYKKENDVYYVHVDKRVVEKDTRKYGIEGGLKNGSDYRDVPVTKEVYDMVTDYYEEGLKDTALMEKRKQEGTEEFIFVNQYGRCHNKRTLERGFDNYLKRHMGNDSGITLHMLRHTYATYIKDKIGIDVLSHYLGHADLKITADIYVSQTSKGIKKVSTATEELMREFHE